MVKYFLDTYALVEILKGNKNVMVYLDKEVKTSSLNLYEIYYFTLRNFNKKIAVETYYSFKKFETAFHEKNIFDASEFKLKHKKTNISYTDALGYTLAAELGMKFVTGDKEFKNMENVEFIH